MNAGGISPTGVPAQYVVVWEWENRPHRWRPYSPEAAQLIERAHNKKLSKFYLKDADAALADYSINMPAFEQVCERTGNTYPVRREFYMSTGPAGKGSRWEWGPDDWHVYDMEVQEVLEEAWHHGEPTVDVSKYFPGCPYIMNFCNMTQVRSNSGAVRPIRRVLQPSYPMVKLTQAEIASMIHRKEERMRELEAEAEKRKQATQKESKKKMKSKELVGLSSEKSKKAVKHIMNQLFHHKDSSSSKGGGSASKEKKDLENFLRRKSTSSSTPFIPQSTSPPMRANGGHQLSASSHNLNTYSTSPRGDLSPMRPPQNYHRRGASAIGHPGSAASEFAYPVIGRRHPGSRPGYGPAPGVQQQQHQRYRRMQDSYSSFSDNGSSIIRRPSCDTISTYLSGESSMQNRARNSYYGGSLGSQELLDIYGDEDSVFDDYPGDSVSMVGANNNSNNNNQTFQHPQQQMQQQHRRHNHTVDNGSIGARSRLGSHYSATLGRLPYPPVRGAVATPPRQRVLSDPSLDMILPSATASASASLYSNMLPSPPKTQPNLDNIDRLSDNMSDLYVNQNALKEELWSNASASPRNKAAGMMTSSQMSLGRPSSQARRALFASQNSLAHSREASELSAISNGPPLSPSRAGVAPLKKRPVPTPRSILNTTASSTFSEIEITTTPTPSQMPPPATPSTPNGHYQMPPPPATPSTPANEVSAIDSMILRYAQFVAPETCDLTENCHICQIHLSEASPCDERERRVVSLTLCHHRFHFACLQSLMENQPGGPNYVECAACHTVSGEKWGDMPPDAGSMTFKIVPKGLPGFPDYHTIQITYNFSNGIQGPNHPLPGQPFFAIGFPKTAFLPDTEAGRRVLTHLETAFNRRLTFTIARDPSTGQEDVLDWSPELEHKTEWGPTTAEGGGKGYPDAEYLDRVMGQLGMLGLVQQEHDV